MQLLLLLFICFFQAAGLQFTTVK